jgi:UDP-N-acetylglucosamine acyltransferase
MNNFIHPSSIIDSSVKLGKNNYIGPNCFITGDTIIGDNNRFEAYCSIGTPAEHRDYFTSKEGKTIIGSNNIFREFTTVNAGTKDITILHNNIIMLKGSYVGHDSIINNNVSLSCGVLIGGHSYIMEGCNFGLGSICHQFSIIGAYSMIGMGTIITKSSNIAPGGVYVGLPAKYIKDNIIGLQRSNIDNDILEQLRKQFLKYKNEI